VKALATYRLRHRWGSGVGAALLASVLPLTAVAAEPPPAPMTLDVGSDVTAWALAGIMTVIALVTIGFVIWKNAQARRFRAELAEARGERDRLQRGITVLQAIVDGAPGAYYCWHNSTETISQRLVELLNLPTGAVLDWAAVRGCLTDADMLGLDAAMERLRDSGEGFDVTLATRDGARSLNLVGALADNVSGMELLWFRDVTSSAAERRRLAADAAALTAELDRLRELFDPLPVPVWQRARDLSLIYCNRAYAEAVDTDQAAAVKQGREIATAARSLTARALKTGTLQSESHHVVIGGARRLIEFNETPLGDGERVGGFAHDFTDLENLQSELGQHIAAHGAVLERLTTAIAIFGRDMRLKFFNHAYVELWRLEPAWLRTEPDMGEVLEALHERRRLPEVADFRAFKQERLREFTSLIEPVEELLYLPDETTLRQVVSPHPLGGLVMTYEDVTDKLALERSYNTLIAVQRETLDELYEGVAVYGTDGRLKLSNPVYERLWQIPPGAFESEPHIAEVVEQTKALFDYGEDWDAYKAEFVGRITDRASQTGRLVRTDGSVVDYATVPLSDGSVLNSYLDVTDSYRVERALRERNEALEEADRLKTEFLANVSYELRTPLNTAIGFSEILTQEYFGSLNEKQREYCEGILQSSQLLLSLINDILDLAMIEAGQLSLEVEEISVRDMLDSVLNLVRERAREQGVRLNIDCPDDVGRFRADERRVKQVLFNLLSNSLKYTTAGDVVGLSAHRDQQEIVFEVQDNGAGIAEADQERVFEAFEQAGAGERRQAGTGLGLALVKRFIELHGGRVDLASAVGEGTRVVCHLPTDSGPAATASID
jgi:signal transduction histidine kinase